MREGVAVREAVREGVTVREVSLCVRLCMRLW